MVSGRESQVSVKEAANRLNITERTVWKYIQKDMLKTSRRFSSGKKPAVMVFEGSISELLQGRSVIEITNDPEGDLDRSVINPEGSVNHPDRPVVTLPVEFYAQQQKEHEQALTGMMMYRWKYEELDRQVKLLPAPVEVVPSMVQERDARIRALEDELAEKSLPWWKRMFRNGR